LIVEIQKKYPQLINVSLADIAVFGDSSQKEYDVGYELRNITNFGINAKRPLIIQYKATKMPSGIIKL
jgi:methyl coenzyme M reductase beta subunit